jgi:hypothetical protein
MHTPDSTTSDEQAKQIETDTEAVPSSSVSIWKEILITSGRLDDKSFAKQIPNKPISPFAEELVGLKYGQTR